MEFFSFPFLFPSFCHSVIYHVVSIVSDGRHQSSFVFFYIVFESLYGYVNAVFDAGKFSSSFLIHRVCQRRLWVIIIIIIYSLWVFTSALVDGLSLKFEWQQVSSSLQDSSQYSGWSQYCSNLDGLYLSSYFQVLQSLYQSFGDCTEWTNYNWYHRHCHILSFFLRSLARSKYLYFVLLSFNFTFWSARTAKSTIRHVLFFGGAGYLLVFYTLRVFHINFWLKIDWQQDFQDSSKYSCWF